MEVLNFVQFCTNNNYPCDHDTLFQAQFLGARGFEGRRQSLRSIKEQDKAFEKMLVTKELARAEYIEAVFEKRIIDPSGKVTRGGILKHRFEFEKQEILSSIDNLKRKNSFIGSLGSMSHKSNGEFKPKYLRAYNDNNSRINALEVQLKNITDKFMQEMAE